MSVPVSEWCERFVTYMRNRMEVSFHKYGPVAAAYPHKVSAIESLHVRLEEYARTGNTEYLIDAANFAMIEFMHPAHPRAHFTATDSDGSPGRAAYETGLQPSQATNADLTTDGAPRQAAKP